MSMLDPWSPVPGAEQPSTEGSFLDDPRLRGALLQSGIALMQPPSFGDNPASLIGRAIGAGGESVQRQEAADVKQQEADSKAALREAQATSAGAKAETAGARANTAEARLALQRQGIEDLNKRNDLNSRVRLYIGYNKYLEGVRKANENPLRPPGAAPEQPMSIEDFAGKIGIPITPIDTTTGAPIDPLEKARRAIAGGAPRDAVIQRLKDAGIDPGGL